MSNSPIDIETKKQLILIYNSTNLDSAPTALKELLTRYQSIMDKKGRREVYYYFLDNIAATGALVLGESAASEQNVYSHVKWLYLNGFINAYGKVENIKKGGPRPVLYALPGASKEQLARAIVKVHKSRKQPYTLVLELTQLLFEDIQDMEIQMRKIINLARRRSKGFDFLGIADLVARELHEKGIKVWR